MRVRLPAWAMPRMQQSNFGGAISFLEQAEEDGARDKGVEKALADARFYYTMSEGSVFLSENDLSTAEKEYQAALAMRPGSPEALQGLGGTLMKAQQPEVAIPGLRALREAQVRRRRRMARVVPGEIRSRERRRGAAD